MGLSNIIRPAKKMKTTFQISPSVVSQIGAEQVS